MNGKDLDIAYDIISKQIDLLRLTANEQKSVLEILKNLEKELVSKLNDFDLTSNNRRNLNSLLTEVKSTVDFYYSSISGTVNNTLYDVSKFESDSLQKSITSALKGSVTVQLPTEAFLAKLVDNQLIQGAPSSEWWARQSGDLAFRFSNEVRQGLAQGETTSQIVKRVREIMSIAKNNAFALVNTSVQTVANSSRLETFKQNSDVIKGVRQLSTLDSHTTSICVAYSGGEWDLDGKPINGTTLPFNGGPPRHFNCRSVLVPITKSFKELGLDIPEPARATRASVDGPVSAKITMEEFIKNKGDAFAEELLGKGRAKLYLEGKMTLQQLLDQSGRPLNLSELKAKYGV